MKKTVITVLSFISAVCTLFSATAFVFNVAYANSSTGNITTDANEQPLDSLVEDGGLTSIFEKIAIVGDSLSSGALEDHQQVGAFLQDVTDYSWGQFMSRTVGSTVYNLTRSGMTSNEYCESFAENNGYWLEDYKSDAYYIALGFNDLISYAGTAQGLTAGNVDTDVNVENYTKNAKTFAGYTGQIISRYKAINENAVFFLLTMPVDSSDANRVNVQNAHQTVMNGLAEKFDNTYVIDLRAYAPKYDADFVENYYVGGHLSPAGYGLTAKMVTSYTDYIIRHNTDAFRNLGLTIPEGYTHTVKPIKYDLDIKQLKYQQIAEWNTYEAWSGIVGDEMTYVDAQYNLVNPGVSHAVAITFTAPADGTLKPNVYDGNSICTVYKTNNNGTDGVRFAIYLNDEKIFPTNKTWQDPGYYDGTNGTVYNASLSGELTLKKGDKLHFVVDNGGNGANDYDSTYLVPGFFWSDADYSEQWFDSASAWWSTEENGNVAANGLTKYLRKDLISYSAVKIEKKGILPVLGDNSEVPLEQAIVDGGLAEIIRTAGIFTDSAQLPEWVSEYAKITKTDVEKASVEKSLQAYFIEGVSSVSSLINGIFEINDDAYVFLIANTEEQKEDFSQIINQTDRVYLIDLYIYGTANANDIVTAKEIVLYVDYIIRRNMDDFKTFGIPKMPAPIDVDESQDKLLEVGDLKYQKLPSYFGDQTNYYWTGTPDEDSIYLGPLWNAANPGSTYAIAVGFTAPIDGAVYPDGSGGMGGAYSTTQSTDGARFAIYLNQTKIYPQSSDWVAVGKDSMNVRLNPFKMKAGDTLYYIVENGGNGNNNGDGVSLYIGFHWVDGDKNTKITWFDSANGNGAWGTAESGEENNSLGFKKNQTVSYHYVLVGDRYSITYELNGGTNSELNPVEYGNVSQTLTLKDPVRKGYEFTGWTSAENLNPTKNVQIVNGSTGNKTFTANWEAVNYEITYELNGGTNANNPETYTIEEEITFVAPTREGYTFKGWTINGKTVNGVEKGSVGNVTVVANWEELPKDNTLSPDNPESPKETGGGCGANVSGGGLAALTIFGGAVLVFKRKRNKRNEA